ncbi:MAG: PPC domain-containing protein [Pirellulaceae bacterium]
MTTIWMLLLMLSTVTAQSVCLPAPRLLTTMPMGGQLGTRTEVVISGDALEDVQRLIFSHPSITAVAKTGDDGQPIANRFVVTIADDAPLGIHTARVMTRLGISSPRVFTVGDLPEVVQEGNSLDVASAMQLQVNSICNATLPVRAINHYSIDAKKGQRLIVDCAAKGIDSKMNPVLILADHQGNDLMVQRRGDAIDFTVPADGTYIVKVHELTFQGGNHYFYRLSIREIPADAPVVRQPTTLAVNSFSWPPAGLPAEASAQMEPNNDAATVKSRCLATFKAVFFPAAVSMHSSSAKKGETWWVEVASERLGRPTDPSVMIQQVVREGDTETLVDVAELTDIASPVKRSSNGYAYDGPPYNAGSTDVLGKFDVPQDGTYRLQLLDLFGGTREDARNIYRLIVRKAEPDFALVAWAMHMELRNGDRNALSKPIALRGGSTMAFEVIAVRH